MSATKESLNPNSTAGPAKVDELVDFRQLAEQLKTNQPADGSALITAEVIKTLKQAVVAIDDGLKNIYSQGGDVNTVVYGRANLTDQLLSAIYSYIFKDLDQELAIIAVGGYGRGVLHPKSDLDLMILLVEVEGQGTCVLVERLLGLGGEW